jgi:F-box domain
MSSNTAVAANPSLAGLPMEILHHIFGQVSSKDQRQLRRVSRRCCTAVDSLSDRDYKQIAASCIYDFTAGLPPSRIRRLHLAHVPFSLSCLENVEKLDKSSKRYNGDHITSIMIDSMHCDVESTVRILEIFPNIKLLILREIYCTYFIEEPLDHLTEIVSYTLNGTKYTRNMPLQVWPEQKKLPRSVLPPYVCRYMPIAGCKTCASLVASDDQSTTRVQPTVHARIRLPSELSHQNIEIVIDEPKILRLTIELEEPMSPNRQDAVKIVKLSGNLPGLHRLTLRAVDISNLKLNVHTPVEYSVHLTDMTIHPGNVENLLPQIHSASVYATDCRIVSSECIGHDRSEIDDVRKSILTNSFYPKVPNHKRLKRQ